MVALHGEDQAGTLTKDEVSIVRAVLELRDKTVSQVMTKIEDVFMLPLSAKLDLSTIEMVCIDNRNILIEKIMEKGHSRVPIYHESRQNVIGVVLVKSLGKIYSNT